MPEELADNRNQAEFHARDPREVQRGLMGDEAPEQGDEPLWGPAPGEAAQSGDGVKTDSEMVDKPLWGPPPEREPDPDPNQPTTVTTQDGTEYRVNEQGGWVQRVRPEGMRAPMIPMDGEDATSRALRERVGLGQEAEPEAPTPAEGSQTEAVSNEPQATDGSGHEVAEPPEDGESTEETERDRLLREEEAAVDDLLNALDRADAKPNLDREKAKIFLMVVDQSDESLNDILDLLGVPYRADEAMRKRIVDAGVPGLVREFQRIQGRRFAATEAALQLPENETVGGAVPTGAGEGTSEKQDEPTEPGVAG